MPMSLSMEMYNVQGWFGGWIWEYAYFWAAYPAFVGTYSRPEDYPLILGVCDGLKHVGMFLADARWPGQLMCGDPMNCWRGQYNYSHAIFYNANGDQGNAKYPIWYLFCKSQ